MKISNLSAITIFKNKGYYLTVPFYYTVNINPNPPDPLPLLAPADLFAIPFSTV